MNIIDSYSNIQLNFVREYVYYILLLELSESNNNIFNRLAIILTLYINNDLMNQLILVE